jgi:hypothetical protein
MNGPVNLCPVIRTGPRAARQGVLDDAGGLGRLAFNRAARRALSPRRAGRLAAMGLRKAHRLPRGLVRKLGSVNPITSIGRPGLVPVISGLGDDALYGDDGLGKFSLSKVRKKLHKVATKITHSTAFKVAAAGAALYFTGGLAAPLLTKAGPLLKTFGGAFKGLGKSVGGALPGAIQAYGSTQAAPVVPGSQASLLDGGSVFGQGAGYGGGYGGGGYGTPGGGDATAPESDAGVGAGTSGQKTLMIALAVAVPVGIMLMRRRGR